MERSKDCKRTKVYDGSRVEPSLDDGEVLITKQQTMKEEQLLVNHEDKSLGYASSSPQLVQNPVVAWAVRGLGLLLLFVVVLVVQGSPFAGSTRDPPSDRGNHVGRDATN
ncbi:unnamed protein product [Peronospora effusa]|nr:unnamed protein product [Peronospora effusa]